VGNAGSLRALAVGDFMVDTHKEHEVKIQTKQATVTGPAETFTGHVWFDLIARGGDFTRMRVNVVRFAPGAARPFIFCDGTVGTI
jgi:hypothetical protein